MAKENLFRKFIACICDLLTNLLCRNHCGRIRFGQGNDELYQAQQG